MTPTSPNGAQWRRWKMLATEVTLAIVQTAAAVAAATRGTKHEQGKNGRRCPVLCGNVKLGLGDCVTAATNRTQFNRRSSVKVSLPASPRNYVLCSLALGSAFSSYGHLNKQTPLCTYSSVLYSTDTTSRAFIAIIHVQSIKRHRKKGRRSWKEKGRRYFRWRRHQVQR